MKNKKLHTPSFLPRILHLISFLCIMHCAFSQNNYPIVEKNGKKYYEYTINQGEGLFSIARKFNIKQKDLHEANENLSTDIKTGNKILIPIKCDTMHKIDDAVTTHVVEPKQTLYSISKLYNVNIDTLIKLNPSAKAGIKIGETLIISKNKEIKVKNTEQQQSITKPNVTNNITHIVQRKETLYSISKKYNVAIHDLIALNPELKNGLKAGSEIIINGEKININKDSIPTINNTTDTADNTGTITTINPIVSINPLNYQHSNHKTINIAYLLPLIAENTNDEKNTQRFIEFYRGAILALEKAKSEGISANIFTYNLPKSIEKIDSVLLLLNDKNIDIVIGPAYTEQLNKVLSYTKKHDITTIVPFSNKIDTTYYFPKLIQFNPPQDSLFHSVLSNTFAHRNLQYILCRFENCKNKGNTFINDLAQLLTENNKQYVDTIIKPELIDSIVSKITLDTTIIVLGSSRINDVAPILDSLNRYKLPNLQVWGFEEWGTNIIKKYPQTLYYSLFFANETEEYNNTYKNWFGIRKQSIGVKYDLLGYDITMLALKQLFKTEPKYLQSEPKLIFMDNRWLNKNYYLLFWDNITITEYK